VATFYRARPAGITETQLRHVLTTLALPPAFYLPPAMMAHTRHYDVANQSAKFFDTFVALNPADAVVCVWQEAELVGEDRDALVTLLASLGTFGRAESWCEADLLDPDALPALNSMPLEERQSLAGLEPVRVMMPDAENTDTLETLLIETSTMRRQKHLDLPGARWVTYTRSADALTIRHVAPTRRTHPPRIMTVARYALDASVLPLAQNALPFTEQIRRALIRSRVNTSHSMALIGKTADGTPLEGHVHAHYLVTDEDGDGRLDHITIYAPCGFDPDDVQALGRLTCIFQSGNRSEVRTVLIGLGQREQFEQVPIFAASRMWRSVTPFSLPRFASRGDGKSPRPRDLPEAQLCRELRVRHLPEPVSIQRTTGYEIYGRPVVRWLEFHTRRFKGEQGYGLAGFTIEFAEEVGGPITLGFACHFGLGLFIPA
jgi:CRISPR-associated protein Csb2